MGQNEVPAQVGWFDTIKEKIQIKQLTEKLRVSKDVLVDILLYASIGFLAGFLLKKFSTYVVLFVLMVAALFVLQKFDLIAITINWTKVNEVLGIQPVNAGGNVATMVWEWMKVNVVITVSFLVGFLLGLRVG